jgi:ankyrin repeat protein
MVDYSVLLMSRGSKPNFCRVTLVKPEKLTLQEGAQVNHVDSEGRSALLWAAVHGSVTWLMGCEHGKSLIKQRGQHGKNKGRYGENN